MDKIMEKLNKLSIPIAIIIASLVFGGFFYATQVNKQKFIEEQQQIKDVRNIEIYCRKIGEDYRKNEILENPTISFIIPQYGYNKELNTCLYRGGFFRDFVDERYIIDLNTNTTIATSTYFLIEGEISHTYGLTRKEFEKRESELFYK